MSEVKKGLPVVDKDVHAWTDSTIVFCWLNTNPARLKTYVNQCHHIEGTKNPADCASRGLDPSNLKTFTLWWNGPDCLREDLVVPPVTLELKTKSILTNLNVAKGDLVRLFEKYSDFNRVVRITAICMKFVNGMKNGRVTRVIMLCLTFINNLREIVRKPRLIITTVDRRLTEILIVKLNQEQDFATEIHDLSGRKIIKKKSRLLPLCPFLDVYGCLRVGGRLSEANLPYERKHPLILAPGRLAELIIADRHTKALHGSIKITINLLRESYWVLNLRSQVKLYIRNCVRCIRFKKEKSSQIMADLPSSRVNVSHPFTLVGLDYAGPYDIKALNVRSPPIRVKPTMIDLNLVKSIPKVPVYEGYISLFICLATKSVHLEVVSDKSTEAFLAAFDRFTARKGHPECCFSDTASRWNLGSWSKIDEASFEESGLVGANVLTYEEMSTVTARVEACLNSRPLCQLNDDPDDLSVLIPGHFLVGRPLLARPEKLSTSKTIGKRGS